jgi:hypothetical protein
MNKSLEAVETRTGYNAAQVGYMASEYLRLGYDDGVVEQLQVLLDTIDTLNKRLVHSESERFEPSNSRRLLTKVI